MLKVDLHSHSTVSDGTLSPLSVVRRAVDKKVDVLALTDHDSIEGLPAAHVIAKSLGLKLISGVEISCTWQKTTIHVVGLGISLQSKTMQDLLDCIQSARKKRAKKIGRNLEKLGIKDAYKQTKALANNNIITRSHYAKFLHENSYSKSFQDSFKKYLGQGKPGFAKGEWFSLEQTVQTIHQAGGLAVIAHPTRYKMTNTKLNKLCTDFKALGGDGIEVVNSGNNPDKTKYLSNLCQQYDFLASIGSDFHSPGGFIELGKLPPLPQSCRPIWNQL